MSITSPPTHETSYEIALSESEDGLPDDFRIVVQVRYRRKGRLRRDRSVLPGSRRFFRDVGSQHITMVLEARIGRVEHDYFEFPGPMKKGSQLLMEMDFNRSKLGEGVSRTSQGVVQAELGSN